MPIRPQPPGTTTERVNQRTTHGKAWNRPDGKIQLVQSMSPVHWNNAGVLEDIDLGVSLTGASYHVSNAAPYSARVDRGGPGFTTSSKINPGDSLTTELVIPNGPPHNATLDLTITGRTRFIWVDILPDIDVEIQLRSWAILTYTTIKTPAAAHSIAWTYFTTGTIAAREPLLQNMLGDMYPEAISAVVVNNIRTITIDPVIADFAPSDYPLVIR